MPHLQDLWSEVQAERGDEVVFLNVDAKDDINIARRYWEDKGFTMGVACQKEKNVTTSLGVLAFPTVYVIDPEGKVRYRSAAQSDLAGVKRALQP